MIYFVEYDSGGNICYLCADPTITIVPLVNRVTFGNASGPLIDANGNNTSPFGLPLVTEPAGITVDQYNTLMTGGSGNYMYNPTTQAIAVKVANAPATS